jgi:SAM-dependent methyltransferase
MQLPDIRKWEAAETERSAFEAAQTAISGLKMEEANIARYVNPPAHTVYPLEYAFHLLGNIQGQTVLDYGCGNGINAVPLARRGARVIGLDVSEALLGLARQRLRLHGIHDRAIFIAGSAHDIPLPSESVDIVLGAAILHHLNLDLAAREIHRVLKPGGRAIFQEPVRNSRLVKAVRGMIPYKSDDVSPYERPLTDGDVTRFTARFERRRTRAFSLPFINLARVVPPLRRHILGLYQLDGALLKRTRILDRFAGVRVFEVVKPHGDVDADCPPFREAVEMCGVPIAG